MASHDWPDIHGNPLHRGRYDELMKLAKAELADKAMHPLPHITKMHPNRAEVMKWRKEEIVMNILHAEFCSDDGPKEPKL